MDTSPVGQVGLIGWADLTVDDAETVRDFYREVVGWQFSSVDMSGHSDFCMNEPATGNPVTGICHARGSNAALPPVWLIYVTVSDVDQSAARCVALGGQVSAGPMHGGGGRTCFIRDPAGAAMALFQPTARPA